ncbi:MAG: hypothetical protein MHMPM18_004376 [Marteilia pararefringens]
MYVVFDMKESEYEKQFLIVQLALSIVYTMIGFASFAFMALFVRVFFTMHRLSNKQADE